MRIDCAKGAGLQSGRRRPRGSDWFRDLPSVRLRRFIALIVAVMSNNNSSSSLVVAQPAGRQTAEGGGERPQDPGMNPLEELAVSWMVAYELGRGASR